MTPVRFAGSWAGLCAFLLAGAGLASAQDASTVVADAVRTMGVTGVRSLTFSGSAAAGWPRARGQA